jgi:hypothetical protein
VAGGVGRVPGNGQTYPFSAIFVWGMRFLLSVVKR